MARPKNHTCLSKLRFIGLAAFGGKAPKPLSVPKHVWCFLALVLQASKTDFANKKQLRDAYGEGVTKTKPSWSKINLLSVEQPCCILAFGVDQELATK